MVDPVLVFAIGFMFILCMITKFTGIWSDTNKTPVEDDGIAVDVTGKPINPADAERLEYTPEEVTQEISVNEYETLSDESKEDVNKFAETVETTKNDVSVVASNIQQALEDSIEPDPTNVQHTEQKHQLNFRSKKDDDSVYADTVLISLRSKNNDAISLYNNQTKSKIDTI